MKKRTKTIKLSEQDKQLFRQHVDGAIPLEDAQRAEIPRKPIKPMAMQRLADDKLVLEEAIESPPDPDIRMESGEEVYFRRNGISQQTIRKLRRGYWKVEDNLDLHGFTRVEAKEYLVSFISASLSSKKRCIRIVHGKGLGSKNREPVLKKNMVGWLRYMNSVLAFCQAPPSDGGAGATLVLLRSIKKKS